MDAATAAIIASGVTGLVALGVGWLNPHVTAKRARETELLKLRHTTYVEALQLASSVILDRDTKHVMRVAHEMIPMFANLRLIGNGDIADLYFDMCEKVRELADAIRGDDDISPVLEELGEATELFTEAIRAHIGVDGLDR